MTIYWLNIFWNTYTIQLERYYLQMSKYARGLTACLQDTNIHSYGKLIASPLKVPGNFDAKRQTKIQAINCKGTILGGRYCLKSPEDYFIQEGITNMKNKIFGILHYITKINISVNK